MCFAHYFAQSISYTPSGYLSVNGVRLVNGENHGGMTNSMGMKRLSRPNRQVGTCPFSIPVGSVMCSLAYGNSFSTEDEGRRRSTVLRVASNLSSWKTGAG